ncbi:hypothetical protein FQN50_002103 [Emmonsiellopsis sp. PD_5]|nr:hypothetical protein FQN50_002103 [Emmonsiellopsis sp. PD_5]
MTNLDVVKSGMGTTTHTGFQSPSRKRSFYEVDEMQGVEQTDGKSTVEGRQVSNSNDSIGASLEAGSGIHPSIEAHEPVPSTMTTMTGSGHTIVSAQGVTSFAEGTSESMPATIPPPNQSSTAPSPGSGFTMPVPGKKRKLSPASKEAREKEKEAKAQEKEVKEKQRAEEKVRKEEEKKKREEEKKKREEEKRKRDEEKKKKDEEREEERKKREEKKKVKDEERLAREEEKKKKEQEKIKKEKSQMRLNAFFTKPTTPSSAATPVPSNAATSTSANSNPSSDAAGNTDSIQEEKKSLSDYERSFPPFFLQSHVTLAPSHRFERDADSLKHVKEKVDALLNKDDSSRESQTLAFRPAELFNMMPYKRRMGRPKVPPVKEILVSMQNTPSMPIDLTGGKLEPQPRPQDLLKKHAMKLLKFSEDVRPPYRGTFSKRLSNQAAMKLCRNPFERMVPELNYDYDSEAEWEEPEEGEDLDSEGEEDISEDGDEDMEGFLDDGDEDPVNGKRRIIVGDLEPVCTGICWEGDGDVDPTMNSYRMEVISETLTFPIDPFSTAYWSKPSQASRSPLQHLTHLSNHASDRSSPNAAQKRSQPPSMGLLQPPTATIPTTTSNLAPGQSTLPGAPAPAPTQKPRRPFPPDQVAEFKQVISGSNLTKAGLIEVLKKRFPKVSKDIIKDTLNCTAQRQGQKEADKKWVLI